MQTLSKLGLACAGLIALMAGPAHARIFEGTVGKSKVVVEIDEDGDHGRYFYNRTRLTIELDQAHGDDGEVGLVSPVTGDDFGLDPDGDGMRGTMATADGRLLDVVLHPAAPLQNTEGFPDGLSDFEKYQLSGLVFEPQQQVTQGGKRFRWYVEPVSGQRLFRLQSGYSQAAMDAVNRQLTGLQWQAVSNHLGCLGDDGHSGEDLSQVSTPWLGEHVVSYESSTSWYCTGAAHPDFATVGHSFDMRTGHELSLDEVVVPKGQDPQAIPKRDSREWYAYRDQTLAPALIALLRRYHPQEMVADEGCDYTDASAWSYPDWLLTEKGLLLGASFAHVMAPCRDTPWAIIPWSELAL